MNFSKKQLDNMNKLEKAANDLDNCGDKYCGNIITSKLLKEEGLKFLKNVTKKCRSNRKPTNAKENKTLQKKYDKCFTKFKKRSNYYKKLTKRNKCVDKKCSVYIKKLEQI